MKIQLLLGTMLLLAGCSSEMDYSSLYGSWEPTTTISNGMSISEEVLFKEKGEYQAITSFDDSLVYRIEGNFKINKSNSSIEIKFIEITKNNQPKESISDSIYSIRIINLSESELTLESEKGILKYTKKL